MKIKGLFVLAIAIPLMIACQKADELEEVPDRERSAENIDILVSPDGDMYVGQCIRERGMANIGDCEFHPELVGKSAKARGFHRTDYYQYWYDWDFGRFNFWPTNRFDSLSLVYYWDIPRNHYGDFYQIFYNDYYPNYYDHHRNGNYRDDDYFRHHDGYYWNDYYGSYGYRYNDHYRGDCDICIYSNSIGSGAQSCLTRSGCYGSRY